MHWPWVYTPTNVSPTFWHHQSKTRAHHWTSGKKDNKLKPIPEEALRRVLHYKQEVIAKMLEIAATTKKPAVRFIVTHENVAELLVASFSPNLSLPTLTVGEMNRFYHLARGEGFTVSLDAKGQPVDVRRIKPLFMYEAL